MNRIIKLLSIALIFIGLTACNSDDPVNKWETEFPAAGNYVYSTDATTGDVVIADGCYLKLTFYTDGKADVRMENVRYDGSHGLLLDLKGLQWAANLAGVKSIVLPVVPSTSGGYMLNITDFKVTYLDHYFDGMNVPVFTASMTVDGKYDLTVLQRSMLGFGKTAVTTVETGEERNTTEPYYQVFLDKADMKADLTIYNPRFITAMPVTKMTISDVPFTLTQNGYELKIDQATATTPANVQCTVTDLECSGVYGSTMKIGCTVDGEYDLRANLSQDGVIAE